MSTGPLNRLAIVALALGLLGLWLWYLAPLPLVLGYFALRSINASDGAQSGTRVAWAGLLLGGVGCVLLLVGLVSVILVSLQPPHVRAQDENHLRQIGLAFNAYKDVRKEHFPPAVAPGTTLPPDERLSWLALQLPFLERTKDGQARYTDLAGKLDLTQGYAAPANAPVRVPFRPYQSLAALANPEVPDFTSFVGIAGVGDNAAALDGKDPNAGFFGYARRIGDADLKAGAAYTLAVSETTRGGSWGRGGPGTAFALPATGELLGHDALLGGLHPKGVHLLYADAHVAFVSERFPADLLRAQSRINRAEPLE